VRKKGESFTGSALGVSNFRQRQRVGDRNINTRKSEKRGKEIRDWGNRLEGDRQVRGEGSPDSRRFGGYWRTEETHEKERKMQGKGESLQKEAS